MVPIENDPLRHFDLENDAQALLIKRAAALGMVIEWSAMMEYNLRDAFCSLVGSKYAAVVAGGQGAEWLIQNCRAVLKVHREITAENKLAIEAALGECHEANARRNVLVHGVKTASNASDGSLQTLRSRKLSHLSSVEPWKVAEIYAVADALLRAGMAVGHAMNAAVSPQMMVIGDALAWEESRAERKLRIDETGGSTAPRQP